MLRGQFFISLYSSLASGRSCKTRSRIVQNLHPERISLLLRHQQSFTIRQPPRTLVSHLPNAQAPIPCRPCPIFLNTAVSGEPCWRAILHVDSAWAGNTCNRCHPMRPDPQPFVPEHEWEWERPQGSCWPENRAHHVHCLTGGSHVKTRLVPIYSQPFFFSDTFREYRANEWIDVWTTVMSVEVIRVNIKP